MGYDTLLRRAELVSVKVADLLEEIDGTATLLVRSGKTDGEGRGATLYLARDTVALVNTWREVGSINGGYLFRSVRKDATVGQKLDPSQVPRIYKRTLVVPHFQDHASDNWEPEGAGSDGVVNRSWSGRRSNMLSWSTCSIW